MRGRCSGRNWASSHHGAWQALEEKILLQDPSIDGPEVHPPPSTTALERNPYKGLRPFSEADSGDFFGRDDLIDTLERRIRETALLVVVGASGSGKSSVVRSRARAAPAGDGARHVGDCRNGAGDASVSRACPSAWASRSTTSAAMTSTSCEPCSRSLPRRPIDISW